MVGESASRRRALFAPLLDALVCRFEQTASRGGPVSVYKVIELVGSSSQSWEDAAKNAVETAAESLRDLRVAEVNELDMQIEDGKVVAYRARVKVSFKHEAGG